MRDSMPRARNQGSLVKPLRACSTGSASASTAAPEISTGSGWRTIARAEPMPEVRRPWLRGRREKIAQRSM